MGLDEVRWPEAIVALRERLLGEDTAASRLGSILYNGLDAARSNGLAPFSDRSTGGPRP